jgi:hypothetical protein
VLSKLNEISFVLSLPKPPGIINFKQSFRLDFVIKSERVVNELEGMLNVCFVRADQPKESAGFSCT